MSFQGLASASITFILIGVILGLLLDAQVERMRLDSMSSPGTPARDEFAPSLDDAEAGQSGEGSDSRACRELEQWERELRDWEEALKYWQGHLRQGAPDFNAWRADVESTLASEQNGFDDLGGTMEGRQQDLESTWVDLEAWRSTVETQLEVEKEQLADERQTVQRVWNWAVLALCGASALTIGNVAVAIVRHHPRQCEPGVTTETSKPELRRARLRPIQTSALPRRGRASRGEDGGERGRMGTASWFPGQSRWASGSRLARS